MKNLSLIIMTIIGIAVIAACSNEVVDTKNAPKEIKDALAKSYELSVKLTDAQVAAGKDSVLNAEEISLICDLFKELAIQNNFNKKEYGSDKYYNALLKSQADSINLLSAKTVFLVNCKGYEELGLAIQKTAIQVKDVTTIPQKTEEPVAEE